MKEKNGNILEIEVIQEDGLQDIVKRPYRYWGLLSFIYSLLILIGCISASILIEYKGQKLIYILIDPLMHYIEIIKASPV
jgi:hypothetical protein